MAQTILKNQPSTGVVATAKAIFFKNTAKFAIKVISLTFTNITAATISLQIYQCLNTDVNSPEIMLRSLDLVAGDTIVISDGEKLVEPNGFFSAIASVAKGINWNVEYRLFDKNISSVASVKISQDASAVSGTTFRIKNGKLQVKIGALYYTIIGAILDDGVTAAVTLDQTGEA